MLHLYYYNYCIQDEYIRAHYLSFTGDKIILNNKINSNL